MPDGDGALLDVALRRLERDDHDDGVELVGAHAAVVLARAERVPHANGVLRVQRCGAGGWLQKGREGDLELEVGRRLLLCLAEKIANALCFLRLTLLLGRLFEKVE